MKKVIFICLLSLSVCLSKPAEEKATIPPTTAGNIAATDSKANTTINSTPHTESQTPSSLKPAEAPVDPHNANTTKPQEANNTAEKQANNETKTETKSETKPEINPETKPETKPTETKPASDKPINVKPTPSEGKTQNETATTTTEKAAIKPSEVPTTTPKEPKDIPHIVAKARGFDGPSFIGGMVLTLGLLAIGFMGFKYYKNQTERNYHTL